MVAINCHPLHRRKISFKDGDIYVSMYVRLAVVFGIVLLAACQSAPVKQKLPPIADVHLHFNWNQEEIISAEEVIAILRKQNVQLAVVFSRPSAMAMKMRRAGGDWVIPFWSPYFKPGIKLNWFRNPDVVTEARQALASGQYYGIGEMHLVAGVGPRRDNPVVQGLISLAREFKVPMNVHTDASRHEFFLPVCKDNPDVRFLWAHAGGVLQPDEIGPLMDKCPNVWVELSARDPWHYGGFADDDKLTGDWINLFERFPDRFMVGVDPVWNAFQTYRWYEADEGWSHYTKINQFHRNWMSQLDPALEKKIRIDNARTFFAYALKK